MRTEYSQKYITLGLKIAYYRKKAGYTQEVGSLCREDWQEPEFP